MEKAEIIKNGDNKMVVLPKDFNSGNDEILMRRIGNMVVLVPKDDVWANFMDGINGFTEDFFPTGRETHAM